LFRQGIQQRQLWNFVGWGVQDLFQSRYEKLSVKSLAGVVFGLQDMGHAKFLLA